MAFYTNNHEAGLLERVRISSDGNVGIANATPVTPFDVSGVFKITDDGAMRMQTGATLITQIKPLAANVGFLMNHQGAGDLMVLQTGGDNTVRINTSGGFTIPQLGDAGGGTVMVDASGVLYVAP